MSPVATGRVPAAPSVPSAGVPSAAVAPASTRPGPIARLVLAVLRAYRRFVSPFLPPRCRFAPSCSAYAVAAVTEHGLVRGGWLALRRLARCHPFHPGGVDPVPPAKRANRC